MNTIKNKSMILFEVNDDGRKYEYKASDEYVDYFIEFIATLGFDIKYVHPDWQTKHGEVLIDYMGRQAYTNKEAVRKTRFIGLSHFSHSDVLLRIHINKEIDRDKLKSKLAELVQNKKNIEQSITDSQNLTRDTGIKFITHLKSNSLLNVTIEYIQIHKSKINVNMQFGTVVFDQPVYGLQAEGIHSGENPM